MVESLVFCHSYVRFGVERFDCPVNRVSETSHMVQKREKEEELGIGESGKLVGRFERRTRFFNLPISVYSFYALSFVIWQIFLGLSV